MFLYRISCLGHNCLWLNYELRNRTQIYFLLKACLLVRLWSSHIASTHFVSLPIHKEVITVLIPQLYLEVYFRGFLCQKKKIPSSLVSNYTMTLSGMLSILQFIHENMSPKFVLERNENWKRFKITTHTMLIWNTISSYFIAYLPFISALLSFLSPKTGFSVSYLYDAVGILFNLPKYKADCKFVM